jgi:hypothetical protein
MTGSQLAYVGIVPRRHALRLRGWGGRLIDDSVWQGQRHDRGALWGHKVQVPAAS